ncbi:TIGR02391 family protein [Paeniglutamicibacter sp. ZC-3]|uniref:TIGR02391 family protein n=1 Tax=Paeniglutamicibacter sp. ZC-3 TaxID=2986919 RepID=UPI0021F7CDE2|nr:TIGR02391 family protein [Paeniglutamicibacter sp. ZC-3]MCV9993430.1 TIGR02391 family protein [Paeniglutamicibacter sp. ZC-3]
MSAELTLSFEARTIEHLGLQMYSQLPAALAELIANAYDADAGEVVVSIEKDGETGDEYIAVTDDGHGMSRDDLNDKYLRIGRNRRAPEEAGLLSESGFRKVSGKKGIGKLALFGIGRLIFVSTTRRGVASRIDVVLDWNDMMSLGGGDYHPMATERKAEDDDHGTRIEIRDLTRTSPVSLDNLAKSLSRLFNYTGNFDLFIEKGKSRKNVTRDLRFDDDDIQFTWRIPDNLPIDDEARRFFQSKGIRGVVYGTKATQKDDNRGVIVFVSGRRANAAGFYGASESSYAFSYLSGTLEADYLDDLATDVISSDRASINWDVPATLELKRHLVQTLTWISRDWRRQRDEAKASRVQRRTGRDFSQWTSKQRDGDGGRLHELLGKIVSSEVEMPESVLDSILNSVEALIPEYARLHWRHLHEKVRDAAESDYQRGDYLRALDEAMKSYSAAVRLKSMVNASQDSAIMSAAFAGNNAALDVAAVFSRSAGHGVLTEETLTSVREGQHFLSKGSVAAFRNPAAHNQRSILQDTQLLTDSDCLDMLSLVSHLWRRLDGADVV